MVYEGRAGRHDRSDPTEIAGGGGALGPEPGSRATDADTFRARAVELRELDGGDA